MEEKQYKELIDFIGEKFETVDKRFEAVDKRFDGVDKRLDGVDKRLDGVDKRLDALEFKFDDLKGDFRKLQHAVDGYATQANAYFMEMAAMGNKLTRHERWIEQIADKIGVKLET